MYGIWFSSQSTGMWVITSIGEMSPARMQILQESPLVSAFLVGLDKNNMGLARLHIKVQQMP